MNRTLKKILYALAIIVIVSICIIWSLFGNSISTLKSIEQVDDTQLFTMTYKGDYGFDRFLKTGASTDKELLEFVISELLHGIPLEFDIPDLGCSTFFAESPEGDKLFGRNFDMYYSPALFVRTEPKDGYKSISMVNLSYIGYGEDKLPTDLKSSILTLVAPYTPLDGVNEKGLAVGILLIDSEPTDQKTDKVDITTTTSTRMLLDKCATVEEAIEMLKLYDMHSSANSNYHFHIADATGKSVIVEYIDNEMHIVEDVAATNFLLTPGDYDFGKGQDRYEIIMDKLDASSGIVTEAEAMNILEAAKQVPAPDKKSTTQWSCVYNLTKGSVDISVNMDFDKIFKFSIE